MPWFRADLHLHSCLSPCGDLECSPSAIAVTAKQRGLDLVALADHNSALNCPAFAEACRREGVAALYGIEATSREEVHLLCLFATVEQALDAGELFYRALADVQNIPAKLGDQVYVDVDENILGAVEKHLVGALDYSVDEICEAVNSRGGLFIPAHIDRSVNSMGSQLGFLPHAPYAAVEVTRSPCPLDTHDYTRICNSDAHFLDDIAMRWFAYEAETVSFAALRDALAAKRVRLSIES
ncbi:MAG: PHP domain-containing protein [Spirochaetaceae bacterium]|nr:MAG: PHP domain-containing protein [Spirochaetaceae bacterium]